MVTAVQSFATTLRGEQQATHAR